MKDSYDLLRKQMRLSHCIIYKSNFLHLYLKQNVVDLLQVCYGECNLLCSHLLGSSIRASDSKKAGSVLGTALEPVGLSAKGGMLHKLVNIEINTVLKQQIVISLRLLYCSCNTERKKYRSNNC